MLTAYDPVAVEYPNEQHWIVFDQRVKDSNAVLPTVLPGTPAPEWITQAPTLAALAGRAGRGPVRPGGHRRPLERRRRGRRRPAVPPGHDRLRGPHERPVAEPGGLHGRPGAPPFYGVELHNGTLGTSGGPRIDADGRVRGARGVVPGLYAAGNAAACVFGPAYPGGGATIGPAMTFGYLAGRHAAAQPRRDV